MNTIKTESNILDKIADTVRHRLVQAQNRVSFTALQEEWRLRRPKPKDFEGLFRNQGWNVIAEVKKASPSQGDIQSDIDHCAVARDYLRNGATALSILTEPVFFKGQLSYLEDIRRNHPEAYILQKDFLIDGYQLYEAALAGADAILIIVALLGEKESKRLYDLAKQLGLGALIEVHNEEELEIAVRIGAKLIGVNNRNLKTLEISLDTSRRLIAHMPDGALPIAESGITSHQDIRELRTLGFRGFLVGTHLMQTGAPGHALRGLLGDEN